MSVNRVKGRIIDLEEYEPGVFSARPWWDVSLFWILGWPFRQLWTLGWDWAVTIAILVTFAGWAIVDWMGMMDTIEWAIKSFFAYVAGK